MPDGYSAWVLQGSGRSQANFLENDEKDIKFKAAAKLNRMTVWNYDKEGDLDNPISRALQWTQICEALAVSDNEDDEKENLTNDRPKTE